MSKLTGKAKAKARKKQQMIAKRKFNGFVKEHLNQLVKYDHPSLSTPCESVITDNLSDERKGELLQIGKDLGRTLSFANGGVGLSAPQIGKSLRVIVIRPKSDSSPQVMFDPEIIEKSEDKIKKMEACLSYPSLAMIVERYKSVTVKYYDTNFEERKAVYEGFEARIVQHEVEHLTGKCVIGDLWERGQADDEVLKQNEKEVYEHLMKEKAGLLNEFGYEIGSEGHQCSADCECHQEEADATK